MAWLLSTVQNGGSNVEFWASMKANFVRKTCTLEPETSVNGRASCEVFVCVRVTFFKQRHIQATIFPYLFFDWFSGFSL